MAKKIGFIGVGNMASAIVGGLTSPKGGFGCADLVLYDCLPDKCAPFCEKGALHAKDECDVVRNADVIVLAVKPQGFPALLDTLSKADVESKLFVTIAAGITVDTIASALRTPSVVRVLPNTPMLIGQGVSVICRNQSISPEDFAFVVAMFEASGRVVLIEEAEMNRIISVTSSSPAYVFAFIKAICDGAAAQGLTGEHILPAVCDVVIGAAMLLKQGGKTPEEQISMVTSKGGTTERAMAVLAEEDLNGMIESAMKACTRRAEELSGH